MNILLGVSLALNVILFAAVVYWRNRSVRQHCHFVYLKDKTISRYQWLQCDVTPEQVAFKSPSLAVLVLDIHEGLIKGSEL